MKKIFFEIGHLNFYNQSSLSNDSIKYNEKIYIPNFYIDIKNVNYQISGIPDTFELRAIYSNSFTKNDIEFISNYITECKIFSVENSLEEIIFFGNISQVNFSELEASIFMQSKFFMLQRPICKKYSTTCRAKFGDKDCSVNLLLHCAEGVISSVVEEEITVTLSSNFLKETLSPTAELTLPCGYSFLIPVIAIVYNSPGVVKLAINTSTLKAITLPGLKIKIYSSCDKSLSTCNAVYKNAINFRGEPFMN